MSIIGKGRQCVPLIKESNPLHKHDLKKLHMKTVTLTKALPHKKDSLPSKYGFQCNYIKFKNNLGAPKPYYIYPSHLDPWLLT